MVVEIHEDQPEREAKAALPALQVAQTHGEHFVPCQGPFRGFPQTHSRACHGCQAGRVPSASPTHGQGSGGRGRPSYLPCRGE